MGEELETTGLKARAGVLTGEAAVTLGAEGQGMVAGDLVNTASRIQALADPGTILVGEVTRRATEAAVVYEQAGEHEVKGKAEPVSVFRAVRVIGGRGGGPGREGPRGPVGRRGQEPPLGKDLFHTPAEGREGHLPP